MSHALIPLRTSDVSHLVQNDGFGIWIARSFVFTGSRHDNRWINRYKLRIGYRRGRGV